MTHFQSFGEDYKQNVGFLQCQVDLFDPVLSLFYLGIAMNIQWRKFESVFSERHAYRSSFVRGIMMLYLSKWRTISILCARLPKMLVVSEFDRMGRLSDRLDNLAHPIYHATRASCSA
jgi:hypothetical protein